jgi:hypothetical protein
MSRKQNLAAATRDRAITRALGGLTGCPVGGWGETRQAYRRLLDELPRRSERSYTVDELVAKSLRVDSADRYRWREAA